MAYTPQNERLINFIQGLDDTELSYFYKYKGIGMIKSSTEEVEQEIKKRGINPKKIINKNPPFSFNSNSPEICPRCGSDKLRTKEEKVLRITSYGSYKDTKYTPRCRICNYLDEDRSSSKIRQRLKRFLGPLYKLFIPKWRDVLDD